MAQYQYYAATQDKTWLQNKGWPLLSSLAEFWASQVVLNSSTGLYSTLNESEYLGPALGFFANSPLPLADPDEYANFKNNAAYTNAGISVVMKNAIELAGILGQSVPTNWSKIGEKVTVLADNSSGIVLEYGEKLIVYVLRDVCLTGCRRLQWYHRGEAGGCCCELYSLCSYGFF